MKTLVISKFLKLLFCSLLTLTSISVEIDLDTEELYVIEANKTEIHDSISLFYHNGDIYVPAKPLLNSLNTEYKSDNNSINGWIFDKTNIFNITTEDTENTFITYDEIYFNLSKFCKTNNIKLENIIDDGILSLSSSQPFAFEMENILKNKNIKSKRKKLFTDIENEYKYLTSPLISLSSNLTISSQTNFNGNINTTGDTLWGTLKTNTTIENDKIKVNNASYSKVTDHQLISSIELGDIYSHSRHQQLSNFRGRGFALYNKKEDTTPFFTNETIQGHYKPNYTVELLDNGHVIESTVTDSDGYYRFNDTPLFSGTNYYSLKFYGEFGDIHEEDHTYKVNGHLTQKEQWDFGLFFIDTSKTLFNEKLTDNGKVLSAEISYGVLNNLTYNSALTLKGQQGYISNSITNTNNYATSQIEITNNLNSWSATARSTGNIANTNFNVLFTQNSKNFSLKNEQQKNSISIGLNKQLISNKFFINNLSSFAFFKEQKSNNQSFQTSRIGFDARIGKISTRYTHEKEDTKNWNKLSLYTAFKGYRFRYEINSDGELTKHKAEINKRLSGTDLSLQTQYDNISKKPLFTLSARKQFKHFDISSSIQHSNNNTEFGINLSTSLWFDKKPHFTRQSLQTSGSFEVTTYIDENYNNQFDFGDKTLPDIKFNSNSLWTDIKTDSDGKAILPGVNHLYPTEISINEEEMSDFTLSTPKPIRVKTHEGGITKIKLPLKRMKILEFNIFDEKLKPITDTKFTITKNNKTIKGYTDSDGYYYSETMEPGRYTLTINELSTKFVIENNINKEEFYFPQLIAKPIPNEEKQKYYHWKKKT